MTKSWCGRGHNSFRCSLSWWHTPVNQVSVNQCHRLNPKIVSSVPTYEWVQSLHMTTQIGLPGRDLRMFPCCAREDYWVTFLLYHTNSLWTKDDQCLVINLMLSIGLMQCSHWCPFYCRGLCYDILWFNTLRPRQNGRHFPDDSSKCIFWNENVWISLENSLKFVPWGPINNIPALVQIWLGADQATSHYLKQWWYSLLTYICVTRPQRVNDVNLYKIWDGFSPVILKTWRMVEPNS